MPAPDNARADQAALAVGAAAVLGLMAWLAGWTGPGADQSMLPDLAWVLLGSAPWALLWIVSALGWGWIAQRLLLPETNEALALQAGLGTAVLLVLDSALGTLGALQWGGGAGAWVLLAGGLVAAAKGSLPFFRGGKRGDSPSLPLPPIATWAAAPAVAVLLLAACSAPGWLWASEFGGYDAMSYHLELPKEWLDRGRISCLDHNVYSFLPGHLEAAYYHLAVLVGDGIEAVYACQLLHAGLTIIAALVTGRLAARLSEGRTRGAAATVVVLGTPWVVVAGSLAYNEMAVVLLEAAMLLVIAEPIAAASQAGAGPPGLLSTRAAAAAGLLAGAACGVKLTAAGFVAAPLAILLLVSLPPRAWPSRLGTAAAAGLVALAPWMLRNALAAGNPFFPLDGGLFGTAHWTAEQCRNFLDAHRNSAGAGAALAALWDQVARYGIGPSPTAREPWAPQWSILPWLTVAALMPALAPAKWRRPAIGLGIVLLVQVVFWMGFTHLKSRFLLPAVVPAAVLVSLGLAAARERLAPGARPGVIAALGALAGLAWASQPVEILAREPAPALRLGRADVITGDGLLPEQRKELAPKLYTVMLNHGLPPTARVLLVGDATPLYFRGDVTYCTVWDRGPMTKAIDAAPDNPRGWFDALAADGFTHLLIEPALLAVWQREGWGDPRLDPDRLLAAASLYTDPVAEFPDGRKLFRLR